MTSVYAQSRARLKRVLNPVRGISRAGHFNYRDGVSRSLTHTELISDALDEVSDALASLAGPLEEIGDMLQAGDGGVGS